MRAICVSLVALTNYFLKNELGEPAMFRLVNQMIYNLMGMESPRPMNELLDDLFNSPLLTQTILLECGDILNQVYAELEAGLAMQDQFERIYVQKYMVVLEYQTQ